MLLISIYLSMVGTCLMESCFSDVATSNRIQVTLSRSPSLSVRSTPEDLLYPLDKISQEVQITVVCETEALLL